MERISSDGSAKQTEFKNCKQCGAFYVSSEAIERCSDCERLYENDTASYSDAYEGEEHHGG